MDHREQYERYQRDRISLAAIGARLDSQIRPISVRLPRTVAELAVAAWNRDRGGVTGSPVDQSA